MKGIKKRLERLENRTMPKKTVYLSVGWEVPGETEEEAWERHLIEHPEDKDVTEKLFSVMWTGRRIMLRRIKTCMEKLERKTEWKLPFFMSQNA